MIGVGMIALAMALAYCAWCWRDEKRAARNEKREEQMRLNASFDSIQRLILQWTKIREAAEPPAKPPFPTEGDNFTTLSDDKVVEFGKRPKPEPDGAA
jgi:hypothetical protein